MWLQSTLSLIILLRAPLLWKVSWGNLKAGTTFNLRPKASDVSCWKSALLRRHPLVLLGPTWRVDQASLCVSTYQVQLAEPMPSYQIYVLDEAGHWFEVANIVSSFLVLQTSIKFANPGLLKFSSVLVWTNMNCYDLKLKGLSNKTTLVLSNTRELDRVPSTK